MNGSLEKLRVGAGTPQDGYGQSWLDDLRAAWRFRGLKARSLTWTAPGDWPGDIAAEFPILGRFGDGVVGWRREGAEDWFIVDRVWNGWRIRRNSPSLLSNAQKRVVTGHDFDVWPAAWTKPEAD